MASRWLTFGVRPPAAGATRHEGLRFIRDMQLRSLVFCVPVLIVLLLVISTPVWFVAASGVALALLVLDAAWLTFQIHRRDGS